MMHANKIRKTNNKTKKIVKPSPQPGTNIKVYLRCKSAGLKSTKENNHLRLIDSDPVKEVLLSSNNIVYGFDRVFKEDASQKQLFDHVALPILNDVLRGFCCTIFAYGQTGTGKTYTMEGDTSDLGMSPKAGIIPRIIQSLFQQFNGISKDNYITVSMLELYNEELHDLLAITDDSKQLGIYEDKDLGVRVKNLKEIPIRTAAKGIELMQAGINKRSTAATNLNEKSSRSHSIFTINVYRKQIKADGTEEFNVGRLNLVDLAGSENTKIAGSNTKSRAREASSINKSLLTLGRVITCLVEGTPHTPYRESKLTRLLKDSLGGSTKTCIIATVSPSSQTIDDLRSTLEYASKAKQISNTPASHFQIRNARFEENIVGEFERIMDELRASHERNGVYMSKADFDKQQAEYRVMKEEKEALEEEAKARSIAEEARVAALKQQHQDELLEMQRQLAAVRAEADRLAVVAKDYETLCELTKKHHDTVSGFLSRKRGRED